MLQPSLVTLIGIASSKELRVTGTLMMQNYDFIHEIHKIKWKVGIFFSSISKKQKCYMNLFRVWIQVQGISVRA